MGDAAPSELRLRAGGAGLRAEASLEAGEGLLPWLEGLPGDGGLFQSPSLMEVTDVSNPRFLFQLPSNGEGSFSPNLATSLHSQGSYCT